MQHQLKRSVLNVDLLLCVVACVLAFFISCFTVGAQGLGMDQKHIDAAHACSSDTKHFALRLLFTVPRAGVHLFVNLFVLFHGAPSAVVVWIFVTAPLQVPRDTDGYLTALAKHDVPGSF